MDSIASDALHGAIKMESEDAPPTKDLDLATKPEPELPSKPTTTPTAPQDDGDDLQTKIFRFLSTATPEALAVVGVGLCIATYLILGQLGLILIGAFTGISLFISWEARQPQESRMSRKEAGYDVLDRLLETKSKASSDKTARDEDALSLQLARSFDDFQPETRNALNSLVDAVIRDYVEWWYDPIIPSEEAFPLSCRRVFTRFILSVSNQLSRKRPADAFVDFLTNTCSIIIVFFSEMTAAYAAVNADSTTSATDAIYGYLSSNTDSPLSNLLNQRQQAAKFRMVADDLLAFLDRSVYECDPAKIFLRQILSNIVLEGTLQSCSKAEWINGWIVYLLESGETDLSQAIDDAIQEQKAFADVDGNFGNISLAKGNRNSYELDRARKKEKTHKKQLSKADEEMERAMEEMKKLNEMIAQADKARDSSEDQPTEVADVLENAIRTTTEDVERKPAPQEEASPAPAAPEVPVPEAKLSLAAPSISADGTSIGDEPAKSPLRSPVTPKSTDVSSQSSSPTKLDPNAARFTNFDQIVPQGRESTDSEEPRRQAPLTMHNASITILDDPGNGKEKLRARPGWEYLIQIEPASSQHPGWMAMKTYPQFETLHESLRRLAAISGATAFLEAHATFPAWKQHTRSSLRAEVERYLRAACAERVLAESEAMKRFLDRSQDAARMAPRGFSFESMGKGMLDGVLSAPKGILDGGKVVAGGVTGVLGNIGLGGRKPTIPAAQEAAPARPNVPRPVSLPVLPRMDTTMTSKSRDSLDSQRSSVISTQPGKIAPMDRRPSYQLDMDQDGLQPSPQGERWERSAASSRGNSRASSMAALRSPIRSPSEMSLSNMKLPPPPNEISDDYDSPSGARQSSDASSRTDNSLLSPKTSFSSPPGSQISSQDKPPASESPAKPPKRQFHPLSEQETRVAVELLFAVINELYTLSSAWNIRRTLLTAAKSYLIRPGNDALGSIQSLLQESLLEANTSDAGMASHIRKLRENSLPTEEERKAWPAELTAQEKEELRVKARKLFIQSGVPAALMGIMGQSATSEALGRLFDCLQIEEVTRGLLFGIMLQAVRVITH